MEMAATNLWGGSKEAACCGYLQEQKKRNPNSIEDAHNTLSFDNTTVDEEPLPPLLKFLSLGLDPFPVSERLWPPSPSELKRGFSVPTYFQDVEKGTIRACLSERIAPPDTLALTSRKETMSKSSTDILRSCQSERFYGPVEAPPQPKKKLTSKFSFKWRKVSPELKIGTESHGHSRREKPLYKKSHSYKKKFFSQPNLGMPMDSHAASAQHVFGVHSGPLPGTDLQRHGDEKYDIFKTRTGILERPFARLYARPHSGPVFQTPAPSDPDAGRYFSALKGPELDILRDSEETVLSVDKKWPFLLRFPIGCFGICLGLGSQSILWKTLSTASSMHFLHAPKLINLALWCLALITFLMVFTTYSLKCLFYFEAVRREFRHPIRINFFFAPWIACMFLTLGVPHVITVTIHPVLWVLFMAPLFILELKIYGQWLSGGAWRLSKVANPSTHLSLVGNFVGALLAATVGWKELAIFFWAVGLAHYIVLFVTLYQRLPTAAVLPKELHPVFFLFVAAPSTASVAWSKIVGDFDLVSRIAYFVGLFLYSSLVVRVNFFRGFRFSVAWWAYTFPMTASAIATIHYSLKVNHPFTKGLAVVLSLISSVTVLSLCLFTFLHIFFWRSMFPNDVAIAITNESNPIKRKIDFRDSVSSITSPESYKSKAWLPAKSFLNEMRKIESHLLSYKSDPSPATQ